MKTLQHTFTEARRLARLNLNKGFYDDAEEAMGRIDSISELLDLKSPPIGVAEWHVTRDRFERMPCIGFWAGFSQRGETEVWAEYEYHEEMERQLAARG